MQRARSVKGGEKVHSIVQKGRKKPQQQENAPLSARQNGDSAHSEQSDSAFSEDETSKFASVSPNVKNGKKKKRKKPLWFKILLPIVLVIVLLIGSVIWLYFWANAQLQHVDALSKESAGSAETYLIVGTDTRDDEVVKGEDVGSRTDTIMLLIKPKTGPTALISIPRDSLVNIPDHGDNKINAAYVFGGPKLIVRTVEELTNMKVNHYLEISMKGVKEMVDAVGMINVCSDLTGVNDPDSGLKWDGGCKDVDGNTALAFSRMRHQDPEGDIGRANRQRQVVSKLMQKITTTESLLNVQNDISLIGAGAQAVRVDEKMDILSVLYFALDAKVATSEAGITGTPPIESLGYYVDPIGSTVLLGADTPSFFKQLENGELPAGKVNVIK
jgi:LCP family protein required for cell wall assembly